eukprot:scaffold555859_cov19-Prasinocladus_malaysianus.AAC.1
MKHSNEVRVRVRYSVLLLVRVPMLVLVNGQDISYEQRSSYPCAAKVPVQHKGQTIRDTELRIDVICVMEEGI